MAAKKKTKRKVETDVNVMAHSIVARATGQAPREDVAPKPAKNPAAVALGKLGGLKGGKARAAALSPAKRKAIARKAAKSRWATKH